MLGFRSFLRAAATSSLVLSGLGEVAFAQSASQVSTEDPANLIADALSVNKNGDLVAEGNVEVFYQDAHLRARKVTYVSETETLQIEGPIRLTRGAESILLADSAELDRDLQQGLLRGARVVLDQQLQMAAAEIRRVDGRYLQLKKTVASSCEVCAANPVPLWEIRAQSILHDQEEKQLYFDQAHLRVMGLPVFYIPSLRLPDPTLERARGFLIPSAISDSNLATGVRLPYFIPLGDSKDITLAPLVTSKTKTMEFRYRQMFAKGEMEFVGALSRDTLRPDETRGYLFGGGAYDLPQDFLLTYRAELVSDPDYLLTYDYTDRDLLDSFIDVSRTRRNEYIQTTLSDARSLRETDDNATLPNLAFDAIYERRFTPSLIGGSATLKGYLHSHKRASDEDVIGRDMRNASVALDWKRTEVIGSGLLVSGGAEIRADYYGIRQDSTYPDTIMDGAATLGAELRWPLLRRDGNGATHLFEPVLQAFYSPFPSDQPPNEDSQEATLDAGNLFSDSRFTGVDRREAGAWANIGFNYRRTAPNGLNFGATVGRILRAQDPDLFNRGSGLDGKRSDWLASFDVELPGNLVLASHSLIDDDFSFSRNETQLRYFSDRFNISTGYLWLTPEPALDRNTQTSEWTFDTDFIINNTWSGDAYWRYDIFRQEPSEAGFGFTYQNECLAVDLSVSHRFTSSTTVDPSTSVGMKVALTGFGDQGNKANRTAKKCLRYN
ncbi:LPS-assembly protein LptD [Falsihalocynthiibacter sp. SS001]|uniref:LPS-assembly protein LptD n=1 Tax=Falsihalocynthiibacter sp. SS001 TaxID=3349698 RepID=UPI0036D2C201